MIPRRWLDWILALLLLACIFGGLLALAWWGDLVGGWRW